MPANSMRMQNCAPSGRIARVRGVRRARGARDRRGGTGAQCAAEREENILRERGLRLGLVDLEGGNRRRKARAGEQERRSSGAGGRWARCHAEEGADLIEREEGD